MKKLLVLLLLVGCSSHVVKRQPDMFIPLDGDYIAGCIHTSIMYHIILREPPNKTEIEAYCMDLYLGWLDHKSH